MQQQPSISFGTNIGHWLSQSSLDRNHLSTFFTEEDVKRIAGWGMDHIRLPVDYNLFENEGSPRQYSEEGLGWIDRGIEWCECHGLWVVLDMHFLPGHHFGESYLPHNLIWNPEAPFRARARAIWRMLAKRYAGAPRVVLEVLNEPVALRNEDWNSLARELHETIRDVNRDSWIMIPSNEWDHVRNFGDLVHFDDPRTCYTFHMYEPILFTHQNASWVGIMKHLKGEIVPYPGPFTHPITSIRGQVPVDPGFMATAPYGYDWMCEALAQVLAFQKKHNALLYCGEFGVLNTAPKADRLAWYRDLCRLCTKNGIGYANWNYRSGNFGIIDKDGIVDEDLLAALRGNRLGAEPGTGRPRRG